MVIFVENKSIFIIIVVDVFVLLLFSYLNGLKCVTLKRCSMEIRTIQNQLCNMKFSKV